MLVTASCFISHCIANSWIVLKWITLSKPRHLLISCYLWWHRNVFRITDTGVSLSTQDVLNKLSGCRWYDKSWRLYDVSVISFSSSIETTMEYCWYDIKQHASVWRFQVAARGLLGTKTNFKQLCRQRGPQNMITSTNGNIFHITGPLWGESTGHRWIPLTKASDAEIRCFLWSASEHTV